MLAAPSLTGQDRIQHLVGGGPWIEVAREHRRVSSSHRAPVHSSQAGPSRRRATISRQLLTQTEAASLLEHAGLDHVGTMGEDRVPQRHDALARRRHRRHDRHPPPGDRRRRGVGGEVQHLLEVAAGLVDALPVGLVDGEDVGHLHQAGLVRLHAVAPAGVDDDDRRVGLAGDLDLDLADPDRLDDDPAMAERIEQADRLRRRQRQAAEVAAGGHRADEDAGIGGVVLHPHAVAEDRPAGERRRRIDGEHGHLLALLAEVRDQRRGQRRLAGSGRAGQPDRVGVAGERGGQPADLAGVVAAALDEREEAGLGGAIAAVAARTAPPVPAPGLRDVRRRARRCR